MQGFRPERPPLGGLGTLPRNVIGCDLARGRIDTHALPSGAAARVIDTSRDAARWAASLPADPLVVFEATSGCDGHSIDAPAKRRIPFARVKPRQARAFARALGVLARSDRVDARLLARMGRLLPLTATAKPGPARTRLADFLRRRKQLAEMRKAGKVRRHGAGQPAILRGIEAMIARLDRRIARLDREIAALIRASPTLAGQARLLSDVPGIGTICRRRIASRAGLARHAGESGTWRGTRRIRGGRRKVREALSIAALRASRRIPAPEAMREPMRAGGKAPKTILIASARQLLVTLDAMSRNQQPLLT